MEFENELARVAERYRSEGFEVTMDPQPGQLPAFAVGFQPDMLATKDGLKVLVQVKKDQEELRRDPDTSRMADVINAQPGWRFDLVVLNRDAESERIIKDATEPSIEALSRSLDYAERAAANGDPATAFIMAWAALEAAMRRAARTAGLEVERLSPLFLLRTLYSNGLLERHEYDELNNHLRLRNAVVHGLEVPHFDEAVPLYVVNAARKLLAFDSKEQPA
jgi:REase_AHJR-like